MTDRKKRIIPWRIVAALFVISCLLLAGCEFPDKRVTNETEETTFGIDVSRYQGTIDWHEVAQSGIDFAIVRVGYRTMSDGNIVADGNGKYNLQEAAKVGIPLGAYFFSTAISEEEAREEAAWVAEYIARYPITYPVVYDCEGFNGPDSRQNHLSKEERTDIALAFLETIEKLGYEGMFYASKNEMHDDTAWEVSRIEKKYKVWVAQYPAEPYPTTAESSYTGVHHMWQYSMEGTVAGISQNVDMNVAYFGYDGIEPAKDDTPPVEVGPDVEALMDFTEVSEQVTAKEETRLRDIPSQGEDSMVLFTLQNGEIAHRVAVSSNGWSKLIYSNTICYAVSSYLTTGLDEETGEDQPAEEQIKTQFAPVNELVTAKDVVNLRKLPSTEREDAVVLTQLHHGDIATRVGISSNGWSKVIFNGETCYGVSSYMEPINTEMIEKQAKEEDVGMAFETVLEQVYAAKAVNLRTLPSTERSDSKVIVKLQAGDPVTRTGINKELGWSRVIYQGQTLYCVSMYLSEETIPDGD